MPDVHVQTRETTVKDLEKPRISLTVTPVTKEGDTVKFSVNIPKTTGFDGEGPLLEIANKHRQYLSDKAQAAFLKSLNGADVKVERINISEGLNAGGESGGNLAAKAKVKGVNVGGEIDGKTNGELFFKVDAELTVNSGKLGRAIDAAESALWRASHELFTDEARKWVKNGGVTVPVKDYVRDHSGNVLLDKDGNKQTHSTHYKVSPDAARDFYNSFTDGPFEIDRKGEMKGFDIRKHLQGFEGTQLEKHATQVASAVDKFDVSNYKKADVMAAMLSSVVNAKFDPQADIKLVQSTNDQNVFIPTQVGGLTPLRADPVNISMVQPGSAQTVVAEMVRNTNPQQIAAVEPQAEKNQPSRPV
jgi:hypothetical protein